MKIKQFSKIIQNLTMSISEEKADIRHQTAASVLRMLLAAPQGYTEEEVALMAINIADSFLDGLSRSPNTVKAKLEGIQKNKSFS